VEVNLIQIQIREINKNNVAKDYENTANRRAEEHAVYPA
jgi:hypothetical protein